MKNLHTNEDPPPIFSNWNQVYAFVLIMHAIVITCFWLFSKYYG